VLTDFDVRHFILKPKISSKTVFNQIGATIIFTKVVVGNVKFVIFPTFWKNDIFFKNGFDITSFLVCFYSTLSYRYIQNLHIDKKLIYCTF